MIKVTFLLLGLLGEDVAVISVLPLDLSRSGKREALFGTGVGFKLCHCVKQLINYTYKDNTLLLFNRSNHHAHALAFQLGHAFGPAVFFQFHGKAKQLLLSLLGKLDGASAEEDGGFHLGSFLQELLRVLELELEVVFVRVGAETDFLDHNLGRVGFHLLGALALLIEVLLVIQNLANGRFCLCADFHQIQLQFLGQGQGFAEGVDSLLGDVISYQANLRGGNFTVNPKGVFVLLVSLSLLGLLFETRRSRFKRRCDSFAPLKVKLTGPVLLPQLRGHSPQTEARSWNPGPRLHGVQIQIPLPVLFLLR